MRGSFKRSYGDLGDSAPSVRSPLGPKRSRRTAASAASDLNCPGHVLQILGNGASHEVLEQRVAVCTAHGILDENLTTFGRIQHAMPRQSALLRLVDCNLPARQAAFRSWELSSSSNQSHSCHQFIQQRKEVCLTAFLSMYGTSIDGNLVAFIAKALFSREEEISVTVYYNAPHFLCEADPRDTEPARRMLFAIRSDARLFLIPPLSC
eukprot:tig00021179_g19240.t1